MTNIQRELQSDPQGEAETARIASGQPRQDATEATEAETPPENLKRLKGESPARPETDEAVDRATASLGDDEG